MTNQPLTAILGAAGATGKAITRALTASAGSAPVRVVGRNRDRLVQAFGSTPAQILAADLETPEGAVAAVAGADTVVLALGLPYDQFERYPALMRNVVEASERAGVRRFLLITNIYPYGKPQTGGLIDETHPTEPCSFKGQMRLEQERILMGSTKLDWIILRLPDFFGPDAELSYAHSIFQSAVAGKPAQLIAPADTLHQFVYTEDVGPVVARLLDRNDGWNEVYHFAGSGLTTVEAFARRVYQQAGTPFKAQRYGKMMLRLAGLFVPMMRALVEMHYLNSTPVNLSDDKLIRHLGPLHRTPWSEGIANTLAAHRAPEATSIVEPATSLIR